ncbi:outer envelope protein [Herbaspirillum sp. RTI4]|uniref:outer envelope protein n=1 Tax=Herbaspirillum sp. RTI4 TaxID=3048640 RepID=UPI002AB54768|nr:outer envelope protein [Herbaspirillum sp. RTI4]MDY7576902.1 outer envelope protein [Herbaspirillum sp. RTI4]MEA9982492.1 outer envelope protein [Herbaspirillum sp. RTI4]
MKKKFSASAFKFGVSLFAAGVILAAATPASAEEWSDTSIGYRYGTKFAEPFNGNDISKNIINFTHVGGYKYGTNFINLDLLQSDNKDPAASSGGAQEAYLVYRNTVDFGKVFGTDLKYGYIRSYGATVGFDWNTKNDTGYSSKKRMLVFGPTLMLDVPGFLNTSLLMLSESNQPVGVSSRYTYRLHPMLDVAWGIPLGDTKFAFEGYFDYIGAKGQNEFGGGTAPETHFDGKLMYDLSSLVNAGKNTFRLGVEYEYWRNKFGNLASVKGSLAKTPMVRAEYHF